MTSEGLLATLKLPNGARVDQRVPKKLLLENAAVTAADKRAINDGIDSMQWLAAIKPATTGVPAFRDATREYLEIAVVHVAFRDDAKSARLTELVHRAIPYPVMLLAGAPEALKSISLAQKRWALNEGDKMVLEGAITVADLAGASPEIVMAFMGAIRLADQPRTSMLALYTAWEEALIALNAAVYTGTFTLFHLDALRAGRRNALAELERLDAEIAQLRRDGAKASQVSRQVEINLQLQKAQARLAAALAQL